MRELRSCRASVAPPLIPSAIQGRYRWVAHWIGDAVIPTYPMAGSKWSLTAKRTTRTIASQKSGTAIPALEPTVTIRSTIEPGLVPASRPAGTPMRMITTSPPIAIDSVTGNALTELARHGAVCHERRAEVPVQRVI